MNDDTNKKIDDVHETVKGGFQTLHDRMDREVDERSWSLERLWQGLSSLRQDIASLFRRSP